MKLPRSAWVFVAHLATSHPLAQAVKCGISGFTKPCIGTTDVRYDAAVSYDLKSNSDFWRNYEGLTSGFNYRYASDGSPLRNGPLNPLFAALGNYSQFPTRIFENITVVGTRYMRTVYEIFENAQGGPGVVTEQQSFGSSNFEKDGSVRVFGYIGPFVPAEEEFVIRPDGEAIEPSSATTAHVYASGVARNISYENQISIITDGKSQSRLESFYTLPPESGGVRTLWFMARSDNTKKEEGDWLAELDAAFDEAKVLTSETLPQSMPPRLGKPAVAINSKRCVKIDQSMCPNEEVLQQVDPNFNETPYIEPDGQLEGGIIALFVIVGALFFVACAWLLHRHAAAAQKRRYKEHVIRGIARNIDIAPTAGMIATDELKKEFDHIDNDGGGTISKDELKKFVQEGKIGRISDKDFEALWHAIDIDNSGEVDFVEFISFLGSCGAEFETANNEMKRMTQEEKKKFASQRLSMRNLTLPDGE